MPKRLTAYLTGRLTLASRSRYSMVNRKVKPHSSARRVGPQATRTDGQHPRRLELPLAFDSDLRQEQMARVPQYLGVGELGQGGFGRRAPSRNARHDGQRVTLRHRR